MPEPPAESLLTHYLLENPYPLGIGLLLVGFVMAGLALRDGRGDRLRWAFVPLVLGAAVIAVGASVTTSGEHACDVVRGLIDAVVEEDVVDAVDHFADDATLHLGKTTSIGLDLDYMTNGLSRLADRYDIEHALVMHLRAYSESGDRATAHLGCRVEIDGGYPSISKWVVRVERRGEAWKVTKLTCISINQRPPPSSW